MSAARLLCRTGDFAGSTFELDGATSIGRQRDNDVVLDSELLSRKHARIWEEEGEWWIEDLESRNGTRVDGNPLREPVRLARLAVVTLADAIDLVFVREPGARAAPPAADGARAAAEEQRSSERERRAPEPSRPEGEEASTHVDPSGFGTLPDIEGAGDPGPATRVERGGFDLPDDLGGEAGTMVPEDEGPAAGEDEGGPGATRVDDAGFGALPELGADEPAGAGEGAGAAGGGGPGTRTDMAGFGALPDLPAGGGPAYAVSMTAPGRGDETTFPLHPGRNVVGRSGGCDIPLPDPEHTISREHAALRVEDDRVVLEDLGSANGTWIGGERIERATLRPGDSFTLGPSLKLTLVSA